MRAFRTFRTIFLAIALVLTGGRFSVLFAQLQRWKWTMQSGLLAKPPVLGDLSSPIQVLEHFLELFVRSVLLSTGSGCR